MANRKKKNSSLQFLLLQGLLDEEWQRCAAGPELGATVSCNLLNGRKRCWRRYSLKSHNGQWWLWDFWIITSPFYGSGARFAQWPIRRKVSAAVWCLKKSTSSNPRSAMSKINKIDKRQDPRGLITEFQHDHCTFKIHWTNSYTR